MTLACTDTSLLVIPLSLSTAVCFPGIALRNEVGRVPVEDGPRVRSLLRGTEAGVWGSPMVILPCGCPLRMEALGTPKSPPAPGAWQTGGSNQLPTT